MDIITVSPWICLWKWTSGETGVEKKATPHLSPVVISWGTRDLELQESKHTPRAKAPDACATQYSLQTGHVRASEPPNQPGRAHVYSSFHRSGNRFRFPRFPTHPRLQSTNLSLKLHIQWPFLQTHTVLSLRQPRLECSKEAETRLCSCTSLWEGEVLYKKEALRRHYEPLPRLFLLLFPTPSWKTHQDALAFRGHLDSLMRVPRINSHLMTFSCLCAKSLQSFLTLLRPLGL